MALHLEEPSRQTPIVDEFDLCIIGGSCTGVFAAVSAARLGLRVALVELHGFFGGVATARLVNCWHTIFDERLEKQIIAGLSLEVVDRLKRRKAIIDEPKLNWQYCFNSAELTMELDALVKDNPGIRPFLHARFVTAICSGQGTVDAAVIEDKSGRRAIRAKFFIDASGDSDLVRRAGGQVQREDQLQPPTTPAILRGLGAVEEATGKYAWREALFDPRYPEALKPGFLWQAPVPGCPELRQVFGTRVHGVDCSDADQLTQAEMEGRRQVRSMIDLLRNHFTHGQDVSIAALPACIGIRETLKTACEYRLTESDVLHGVRFDDAIANGSYRVDVHSADAGGLVFRYLDGRELVVRIGQPSEEGRWRAPQEVDPTFYQIPYRSLVPRGFHNVLVAGRTIDTDKGAFGATRVMINCNQTGEAAGVAAYTALNSNTPAAKVDPQVVRRLLTEKNGSILL